MRAQRGAARVMNKDADASLFRGQKLEVRLEGIGERANSFLTSAKNNFLNYKKAADG